METKRQFLRILSIGLMLSIIAPVQAQGQKLTRVQLYKKCIAKKCTPAEKAQVRADAKRAGKAAGVLLAAAAVAIGVRGLTAKNNVTNVTVDSALQEYRMNRQSVYQGLERNQKQFIDAVIFLYDKQGKITSQDLASIRGIVLGKKEPGWLNLDFLHINFVAMLYYKTLKPTTVGIRTLNDTYRLGSASIRSSASEVFGVN